jgi:hypothetical protein
MNVNCVVGCSGSGATSTYGAAFPSTGTAIGFTDGANMVAGKVRTPGSGAISTDPAVVVIDPNVLAAALSPVPCKAAATWNASTGLTGTQPAGCDGSAALWHDLGAVGGTGVATGNGTSGAGNQRVNIASDNSPIPTQGQVNVTATDCSGTVVTGGTAVNAFNAQTALHGFTIFNTNTSEVMWISFTTTAAASTAGSYPIPAATATTFAGGGSFTSPPGFGLNHALSVVAATSAHSFSCTWW